MSRFDYVEYDSAAFAQQQSAKKAVQLVEKVIDEITPPVTDASTMLDFNAARARDNALKSLEETYMWIGKAIRDQQLARNQFTKPQEERTNS